MAPLVKLVIISKTDEETSLPGKLVLPFFIFCMF